MSAGGPPSRPRGRSWFAGFSRQRNGINAVIIAVAATLVGLMTLVGNLLATTPDVRFALFRVLQRVSDVLPVFAVGLGVIAVAIAGFQRAIAAFPPRGSSRTRTDIANLTFEVHMAYRNALERSALNPERSDARE